MIELKDSYVLRGLMENKFDHVLIDIQCYVADKYGFLMTESFREKRHPGDVHGTDPCRGNDLRYRIYKQKLAYNIMDDINNKWEYDYKRPKKMCAVIHGEGGNKHFHIQVHPNTKER